MAKAWIGIDLGGTFIKAALLNDGMGILSEAQRRTPADRGPDGVIDAMAAAAEEAIAASGVARADVRGVGIGSPGPLDIDAGVVIAMPNIPGFDNAPIRDRVGERLGIPAVLENDANAAAWGEFIAGSGQGMHSMVLLTLGTGIGSGIIIGGQLLHGAHGIGAEAGHMIVEAGGEPCGCGQRGCLERYASATYLAEYARRLIGQGRASSLGKVLKDKGAIDAADVNAARQAGDELAAEVWERAVYHLAVACVNLCRLLDPDLIVLGGGMARAGDDLMTPLREHVAAMHWNLTGLKTAIEPARLGNTAGVIGAAGVAREAFAKG